MVTRALLPAARILALFLIAPVVGSIHFGEAEGETPWWIGVWTEDLGSTVASMEERGLVVVAERYEFLPDGTFRMHSAAGIRTGKWWAAAGDAVSSWFPGWGEDNTVALRMERDASSGVVVVVGRPPRELVRSTLLPRSDRGLFALPGRGDRRVRLHADGWATVGRPGDVYAGSWSFVREDQSHLIVTWTESTTEVSRALRITEDGLEEIVDGEAVPWRRVPDEDGE